MSIEPQFASQSETDFTIYSGRVQYLDQIIRVSRDAVFKALENAIVTEFEQWEKTIAKKSGDMRQYTRLAVASQLNGQKGSNQLTFNLSQAISVVSASLGYPAYHYRQSPLFNPKFAGGYQNPTTGGTMPMDAADFIPKVKDRFRQNLYVEMQAGGLDYR